MDPLTEKVLQFQSSEVGEDELLAQVRVLVYFFPRKCGHWKMEESSDFFSFFQHRIPGIIRRFKYVGKDFESYLTTCIRYQMICFQKKVIQSRIGEESLEKDGEMTAEEETEYFSPEKGTLGPETASPSEIFQKDGNRKKALMLCLKSCYFLTSEQIDRIGPYLGLQAGTLHAMVQSLRKDLEHLQPRIEALRERRMTYFLKLHCCQSRLSDEILPELKEKWLHLCQFYRLKLLRTRRALAKIRPEPRHSDIARIMGVPKGTVDSSLATMKKRQDSRGDRPALPGTAAF